VWGVVLRMRGILPAVAAVFLGACSTPSLELATGTVNSNIYVGDVVQRVKCEISDAFIDKVSDDRFLWLRRWTVTTDLTLQATTSGAIMASATKTDVFHSAVNRAAGPNSFPGTNLGTIMQNFTFGLSGNASETALRSDVVSFTVAVDELLQWRRELDEKEHARHVPPEKMTCNPGGRRELAGRLGLKEWVDAALDPVAEKYLSAGDHPTVTSRGSAKTPVGKGGMHGGGRKSAGPSARAIEEATPAEAAFEQYRRFAALQTAQKVFSNASKACDTFNGEGSVLNAQIEDAKTKIREVASEQRSYGSSLSPIYARNSAQLFKVGAAEINLANSDKEALASDCASIKFTAQNTASALNKQVAQEYETLTNITLGLASDGQQAKSYEDMKAQYHPSDAEIWDNIHEINPQFADDLTAITQKLGQAEAIHKDLPRLGEELSVLGGTPLPDPPVTAISHEVEFEVDYGAGFNPSWTLAVWKGPGLGGNLLSLNGARLNLLQIAIGPRGEPALIGEEQKRILDHQTLLLR
jgi:hypothetical protein